MTITAGSYSERIIENSVSEPSTLRTATLRIRLGPNSDKRTHSIGVTAEGSVMRSTDFMELPVSF